MLKLTDIKQTIARQLSGKGHSLIMSLLIMPLILCGCINETFEDEPAIKEPVQKIDANFYLHLHVNLPEEASSRSYTDNEEDGDSSDGQQQGQANESSVNSAYLFLYNVPADSDDENGDDGNTLTGDNLVCSLIANSIKTKATDKSYDVYTKLEKEHLVDMAGKKMHLYVIANMSLPYDFAPATERDFLAKSFSESTIGTYTKAFGDSEDGLPVPLSNYSYYVVDLSNIKLAEGVVDDAGHNKLLEVFKKIFRNEFRDDDGDKAWLWKAGETIEENDEEIYTGEGALRLERMVARIDYKPSNNGDIFELESATDNAKHTKVYLKLISMQLFNLGKEAYLFRHTSAGTKTVATGKHLAFGREKDNTVDGEEDNTKYNWIADCDWDNKKSGTGFEFFNQMNKTTGEDANGNPTDIFTFSETDDAYLLTSKLAGMPTVEGYHPWMYVMENTVSSTEKMTLQYSTGIEFRFVVCDASGKPIEKVAEGADPYRITMGADADGKKDGLFKEPDWEAEVKTDGKVEKPAGYYLTYRYLIDHNNEGSGNNTSVNPDTGLASSKAPMKYAIVRNNIYRISLTGITSLPDPKEPDNPYLGVEIKILAWVKRSITVGW